MSETSKETTSSSLPTTIEDSVDIELKMLDKEFNDKPEKTTWPELIGMTAEEAEKKIKEELVGAYTPVVPEGGFVTYDFRTNRVRIFVDVAGKVVQAPIIG